MSYRKCHSSVTRICVELILPQVCAICGFPTSLFTDVFGLVLWTRSVTRLLVRLWQCRCKGMRSSAKETQLVLQVSACIWVLQKVVTHQEIKTNCMCAFQFRNRIIIWLGIKVPIRRLIVSDKNSGFDSTLVSISAIIISGTMAPPSTHPTLLNWRSTIRLARQIIIRKKYLSPFKWIPSKTDLTELPTNKVKRRKRREDERRRLWGIN